ncbi:MAG: hypothetical protein R8K46_00110 [Mariprofundaceae bacterium]
MIRQTFRQFIGSLGAVLFGACCLALGPVLAALSAAGLGFLINDAILIPLLVLFLGIAVWGLAAARKKHARIGPLALGVTGAVGAVAGLWVFPPLSYASLAAVLSASIWDFVLLRRCRTSCEPA